jgi:hypothetical protein
LRRRLRRRWLRWLTLSLPGELAFFVQRRPFLRDVGLGHLLTLGAGVAALGGGEDLVARELLAGLALGVAVQIFFVILLLEFL